MCAVSGDDNVISAGEIEAVVKLGVCSLLPISLVWVLVVIVPRGHW